MNTSDILNKAADLLQSGGWTGGTDGMRVNGPHCLEGAIQAATGAEPGFYGPNEYPYLFTHPCPAGDAVKAHLNLLPDRDVYEWNDADGRTAEQVIEVLRATALVEAARETQPAEVSA